MHTIFELARSCYIRDGTTYVLVVPFEVEAPLRAADPDARSLARLPGFVGLEPSEPELGRYEITVEVEGGSLRDATDAAEALLAEYVDALAAYSPRLLGGGGGRAAGPQPPTPDEEESPALLRMPSERTGRRPRGHREAYPSDRRRASFGPYDAPGRGPLSTSR